jgi:carbon monoxide dehydrogenase subunit G
MSRADTGGQMATQLESFAGQEQFAAPSSRIFAIMTDPDSLAKAVPNMESCERVDDKTLRGSVRPGFSFLRASLRMVLTVTEATPAAAAAPARIAMTISSQGIGASMKVECRIEIHDDGDGCRAAWEAKVHELKGLITAVSPTLIRGAADKVIRDGWEAVRRQAEENVEPAASR